MAAEVNSDRLDALVLAYLDARAAGKIAAGPEEQLRRLLLGGEFAAAAARLAELCPALATNQWLQFQLKRHEFLSLAAGTSSGSGDGGGEARAQQLQRALDLARRELAPLALHAYCEAYSDFKHCMLALVKGSAAGGDASSSSSSSGGGGGEPSPELRAFAGMVVRAARQEAECGAASAPPPPPPELLQLLRYLLLLHQHQHHSGFHPYWWPEMGAQAQQLCSRLLLPARDALPPAALETAEGSGAVAASSVREHDVQALRTSLGCDREEAVTLLRRARASVGRALQDALLAAHIDEALLGELVDEYAASRGLEAPAAAADSEPGAEGASGPQQASPGKRQRRAGGGQGAGGEAEAEQEGGQLELPAELSEQQLRHVMRQLERQLAKGQAEQALQQLEAAEPAFLPDHPAAAFALHRCCFVEHLQPPPAGSGGGMAAALAVMRQHLSPLAQQHPELQPQLKAALALLVPLPSAAAGGSSTDIAAAKHRQQAVSDALAALRAALHPRCHVREPRLLGLLRDLLSLHAAHFKLQRCQDRFAAELGIPALKAPTPAAAAAGGADAGAAAAAGGADAAAVAAEARQALGSAGQGAQEVPVPGVRVLDSESDEDEAMQEGSGSEGEGSDDLGVPEQAILTVCEFTGLPRHTAIELLLVHGGDAAAVLAQMFP